MGDRPKGTYTVEQLDKLIGVRSYSLRRLLLYRISNELRIGFPNASSCHVMMSDFTHRYVPFRVLGPNGRRIWNLEDHGHLAAQDGFKDHHPIRLLDDLALYMELGPSTAKPIGARKRVTYLDYSIRLSQLNREEMKNDE